MKAKINCLIMSALITTSILGTTIVANAEVTNNVSKVVNTNKLATSNTANLTLADMPSNLKPSIEWVWNNRMVKEGSTNRKNLILDQIYAGKGSINYVVRWQSAKKVTLQQRKDIATMLNRQINNWMKSLKGYDGWPYSDITVKVVGWACADPSQILDKQSDEIVYTDYITDSLSSSNSSIPSKLPVAPTSLSRADHFENKNYSYPGGLDKRFDMYLWGTSNFQGGAGGDWGQRVSDDYILSTASSNEAHIIEHEMGHGCGLPDFYEDNDRPPGGFPVPTIMWAGNSQTITDWDVWMLRYTWSQLKKDTSRFISNESPVITNIARQATASSSYCSSWENVNALNDGVDPSNSLDRSAAVYGNWPQTGTQWVEYDFNKNYTISSCDIYWFKDNQGIDVPASYKIKYWNGKAWVDVKSPKGLGKSVDKYNTTTFTPISTNKLRIEMASNGSYSTGILEWKVSGK